MERGSIAMEIAITLDRKGIANISAIWLNSDSDFAGVEEKDGIEYGFKR